MLKRIHFKSEDNRSKTNKVIKRPNRMYLQHCFERQKSRLCAMWYVRDYILWKWQKLN